MLTLGSGVPAVGDGAMGTMLQALGLELGQCPERWNLERPSAVAGVHVAYAEAGAGWLRTNSFGANAARLAAVGLRDQVREINALAVALARAAAPGIVLVGSVGPSGAAGPWDALYAEQAEALAGAGVDGFVVETIVRLDEGTAAVRAAASTGAGPVIASFTPGEDGRLMDGATPEAAAAALVRAGAVIVGVNCGTGPASLLEPPGASQRRARRRSLPLRAPDCRRC